VVWKSRRNHRKIVAFVVGDPSMAGSVQCANRSCSEKYWKKFVTPVFTAGWSKEAYNFLFD
jgi:hypothetical protein